MKKKNYFLIISRIIVIISLFSLLGSAGSMVNNNFKNINISEIILNIIILGNLYLHFYNSKTYIKEKDKLCYYINQLENYIQKNDIQSAENFFNIIKQDENYKDYEYYNK